MKKVVKFGGSSLANAEQFKKAGDIIRSDAFSAQQKNAALKSIVDRIVFDRERMHIDVDYYLAETPETLDL